MLMLGTKPGSPGRTAGALNLWATSSAPLTLLFNLLLKHTHTHHTGARAHTHSLSPRGRKASEEQPIWSVGYILANDPQALQETSVS